MDLQLTGKKAIVTGASRGIGRAIARQLALEGCDVAICARTAGPLQEAAAALAHESGRQVVPIVCDTLVVGRVLVMLISVTDDGTRIGGRSMSYKPRKLGHVNIFVRNAARARDWYADLLGLHTYGFTPGRAAFMTSDLGNSHEIALVEVGEDAPGPQKGQVGLNHMAWYMDSLDDLKELYFRIKEKNIKIERVSDHGHAVGIYIRDPDGNGIEVSYEMPSSEWGHDANGYMIGGTQRGRLPGPWDEDIARDARART